MPRVQRANVSAKRRIKKIDSVVDDTALNFLFCDKRSNKPMLSYKICDVCRYNKKCSSFKIFRAQRPDIYPPPEVDKKLKIKRKRGRPKKNP